MFDYSGPPLVWVLWVLQNPQFLKVWVLAPTDFGNYSHDSINFYKKCYDYSSLLAKSIIKHPQFEIPNWDPAF